MIARLHQPAGSNQAANQGLILKKDISAQTSFKVNWQGSTPGAYQDEFRFREMTAADTQLVTN